MEYILGDLRMVHPPWFLVPLPLLSSLLLLLLVELAQGNKYSSPISKRGNIRICRGSTLVKRKYDRMGSNLPILDRLRFNILLRCCCWWFCCVLES